MTNETEPYDLEELVKAQSVMIKSIIHLLDLHFSEPKFSDLLRSATNALVDEQGQSSNPDYIRALHSLLPHRAR
jgi:hypothetical protein